MFIIESPSVAINRLFKLLLAYLIWQAALTLRDFGGAGFQGDVSIGEKLPNGNFALFRLHTKKLPGIKEPTYILGYEYGLDGDSHTGRIGRRIWDLEGSSAIYATGRITSSRNGITAGIGLTLTF